MYLLPNFTIWKLLILVYIQGRINTIGLGKEIQDLFRK